MVTSDDKASLLRFGLTVALGRASSRSWPLLTFDIAWTAVLLAVVAAVAVANSGHLSRQPLATRMA